MEKCEWIYRPVRNAHTDCGNFIFLQDALRLPEEESLEPYKGRECPFCGREIDIPKGAYDLLPSEILR